jgi:hypothetical protein
MRLVAQLNAPISARATYDRILLLWACEKRACHSKSGSVKVYRLLLADIGQGAVQDVGTMPAMPHFGDAVFGSGGQSAKSPSVFADAAAGQKPGESLEKQFNQSVTLRDGAGEIWAAHDRYPSQYLALEEEHLSKPKPSKSSNKGESGLSEWSGEGYEIVEYDKIFQKFADRVQENPSQAIRYERGGLPLLYSTKDTDGNELVESNGTIKNSIIPPCPSCGASRIFELQTMPNLTFLLDENLDPSADIGIDWGIITVWTCRDDCNLESKSKILISEYVSVFAAM